MLDRDHNAALNILAKALRQAGIDLNTLGHREINDRGQTDLYSEGGEIIEQADWLSQESSWLNCRGVSRSTQNSESGLSAHHFLGKSCQAPKLQEKATWWQRYRLPVVKGSHNFKEGGCQEMLLSCS